MNALVEKLRRARQSTVKAGDHTFVVSRPTDADAAFRLSGLDPIDTLKLFVVDWPGMTELGLGLPGGTGAPVAFDAEVFATWVEDHPQVWGELTKAIGDAYRAHAEKIQAAEKN